GHVGVRERLAVSGLGGGGSVRKWLDVFLLSSFRSLVCTEERSTLEDFCLHDAESVLLSRVFWLAFAWVGVVVLVVVLCGALVAVSRQCRAHHLVFLNTLG
ncbi:unnamed protein product, partial [Ectocarpus sp. 6 AP-2014]